MESTRHKSLWQRFSGWFSASVVRDDPCRLLRSRQLVLLGCLAGLLLCHRMWCGQRNLPLVPMWDGLPAMPDALAAALYGLMIFLLAIGCLPTRRGAAVGFLAVALLGSLWDQNRWQPWWYQYLALLVCLTWGERQAATAPDRRSALNACRLIMAGTYFWSGLHKANASFVQVVFPLLAGAMCPGGMPQWMQPLAYAVPVLEAGCGVGLLIPQLRPAAIGLGCLMHGCILLSLGPLGGNWNSIIWPWNLFSPLLTIALFADAHGVTLRDALWGLPRTPVKKSVATTGGGIAVLGDARLEHLGLLGCVFVRFALLRRSAHGQPGVQGRSVRPAAGSGQGALRRKFARLAFAGRDRLVRRGDQRLRISRPPGVSRDLSRVLPPLRSSAWRYQPGDPRASRPVFVGTRDHTGNLAVRRAGSCAPSRYCGKQFPNATSNFRGPTSRIFRRTNAQTTFFSFRRKPIQVFASAVTCKSAWPTCDSNTLIVPS